jgi:hypothetical protein
METRKVRADSDFCRAGVLHLRHGIDDGLRRRFRACDPEPRAIVFFH